MAATKKNHIPPHIQKYFNTYGYNKLVPLNTYFQNQTKRITMQNQLKRLENMQYAIQSTINTLPNSNNKKRYITILTYFLLSLIITVFLLIFYNKISKGF